MTSKYYRPDIDGLRAIAVLGVVLFHAGLQIPGGFVGVDVFFVISGYLITQIILRETKENRFSLTNFWVRRIRRIIPAAAAVTLVTFAIGYLALNPSSLIELGKSAIAHSLMMANVFFWRSNGYFSEASELLPLLHTWSLSIEEQFYIFFPAALIFLLKRNITTAIIGLSLIALVSLVISSITVHTHAFATFYLLPTRAWELIGGALVALIELKIRLNKPTKEIFAVAGITAILLPMITYGGSTPFPGIAALLPVGGTMLLIASNQGGQTAIGRVLAFKPLVAIGLTSYSLYLWHWPMLVYCKHIFIEVTPLVNMGAVAVTAVISYFSWKYIEIPFRSSDRLKKPSAAIVFGLAITGTTMAIAATFYLSKGLPKRYSPEIATVNEDINWNGSQYDTTLPAGVPIGDTAKSSETPDFVVWGDSHAMAMADMIDTVSKEQNLSGAALLSKGRPPIPGIWKLAQGANRQKETTGLNKARMQWIIESGVKDVILIGRWVGMVEGLVETEIDYRHGRPPFFALVVDNPDSPLTPEHSLKALHDQLENLQNEFIANDINIWLLLQTPYASRPTVAKDLYLNLQFPLINKTDFQYDTSRQEYEASRSRVVSMFHELEKTNLRIIDPIDSFFREGQSLKLHDGQRAYYRDEDHLTRNGANHYWASIFEDIFTEIKSN